MKSIAPQMREHLDQEVTTLCTCWRIVRRDGKVMGFTDHDRDLMFDGLLHKAKTGYMRSAIMNAAGADNGDLSIDGILDDEEITRADLRNGVYDHARVSIHAVNWADTTIGGVLLRSGDFGEVSLRASGAFSVELRGPMDRFRQNVGELFQRECRASFGDGRCKIKVEAQDRIAGQHYAVGDRVRVPLDSTITRRAVPFGNLGFESGTAGWTGGFRVEEGTPTFLPFEGSKYAMGVGQTGSIHRIYDLSLLGDFMQQSFIDAGQRRIDLSYRMAVETFGWEGHAGLAFFDDAEAADPAIVAGTADAVSDAFFAPIHVRSWQERNLSAIVPPGKKWVRLRFSWRVAPYHPGLPPSGSPLDYGLVCFDAADVNAADTAFLASDPRLYGDVEWRAQTAGNASTLGVDFWTGSPGTVVDGGVTWERITPPFQRVGIAKATDPGALLSLQNLADLPNGFFDAGTIEILDGVNKGFRMEIEVTDHDEAGRLRLRLFLPVSRPIEEGASIRILRGCAKTVTACSGYGNILNYRGEPHVPGTDTYLEYGNPFG